LQGPLKPQSDCPIWSVCLLPDLLRRLETLAALSNFVNVLANFFVSISCGRVYTGYRQRSRE